MQVMWDVETKDIKPKDVKVVEDEAAHQDAVVDEVSAEAHLSIWVDFSPVSPHPKDNYSHLQCREGISLRISRVWCKPTWIKNS